MATLEKAAKASRPTVGKCGNVRNIPPALIEGDPSQPRKTFDAEALRELGESMRLRQIHPITVRPHPTAKGRYMVVAGERRWRAANLVKLDTIRAEVCKLSAAEVAQVQLAENENRVRPPESETADFVARQVERGMEIGAIARAMGRTEAWVKSRQCMANLAPNLKRALDDGKLPVSVAAALCEMPIHLQTSVWESARDASKSAGGQEAYVRAVQLRGRGEDLFGQPVVEFVSGLSPVKRRKLQEGISREISTVHRLAARKPHEFAVLDFPTPTLESLREGLRKLQKLAGEAEKAVVAMKVQQLDGPAFKEREAA